MGLNKLMLWPCALVLGMTLTGCSAGDDPEPDPPTSASATDSGSPTDEPSNEPSEDVSIEPGGGPGVKDAKGAIADLDLGECSTKPGQQRVSGSVTSSADAAVDYVVTLHWTTDEASGVGDGFAVIRRIKPGQTREFTIEAQVGKGATECIPHVMYGKVKG